MDSPAREELVLEVHVKLSCAGENNRWHSNTKVSCLLTGTSYSFRNLAAAEAHSLSAGHIEDRP